MALLGHLRRRHPGRLGMLWLPLLRRVASELDPRLMAFTVGLLAFLAIDATLEGLEIAGQGPQAFGGAGLVSSGGRSPTSPCRGRRPGSRARGARRGRAPPRRLPGLLVAIGIGLHNLGEGLAIGSAYAAGALALGAFLVVGFAIHNTTEGLAIVAPLGQPRPPSLGRLAALGLIAGAPRSSAPGRRRGLQRQRSPPSCSVSARRDRPGHRPARPYAARRGGPHPLSRPSRDGSPASR